MVARFELGPLCETSRGWGVRVGCETMCWAVLAKRVGKGAWGLNANQWWPVVLLNPSVCGGRETGEEGYLCDPQTSFVTGTSLQVGVRRKTVVARFALGPVCERSGGWGVRGCWVLGGVGPTGGEGSVGVVRELVVDRGAVE
jgi:hypothetical protein